MNITSEQRKAALARLECLALKFASEVKPLYNKLGWRWSSCGNQIPTEKQIYWGIKSLLERAGEEPYVDEVQSGGLAIRFDDEGAYLCFSKEYAVFWEETN